MQDSFINGLLDHPHYSRPEKFESISVPRVLLSGHHAKIKEWRRNKSLEITRKYRLDLIEKARDNGLLTLKDENWLTLLENKVTKKD